MRGKYGVIEISEELFWEILSKVAKLPPDIQLMDAEYDGFRRVLRFAASSSVFYITAEGAMSPVVHFDSVKEEIK